MSGGPPGESARGSSIAITCLVPGVLRYRAGSWAIAVAAQRDDASRLQPQEHAMSQRDFGSWGMWTSVS